MSTSDLTFAGDLVKAESLDELTTRLYAGIGDVLGRVCVGFDLLDPDSHDVRSTSASGVSAYFLARYDRFARRADPVLNFAIDNRVVAHNLSMMTPAQWRESSIYEEVFALHRMTHLVYAPVIVDDRVVATLNLGREDGAGDFGGRQLDQIAGIASLLAAIIASLKRFDDMARKASQFASAVDLSNEAMVVSDLVAGTRHVNPAAQAVLASRPDAPGLDEELAHADATGHGPGGDGLVRRSVASDSGVVVTFLQGRSEVARLPGWLLSKVTPREADVVLLVAQGFRDSEIADRLMLSRHTVKGYLREIYQKLGVRSRVDLTRLALKTDN